MADSDDPFSSFEPPEAPALSETPQATTGSGKIYTFYSFKGGVGRSMAMANIACLLAREGKRVLVVDWDLEAPGLEHFFAAHDPELMGRLARRPGVIDLLQPDRPEWRDCVTEIRLRGVELDILHSGKASRDDEVYVSEVQKLDWRELYRDDETKIGRYFDAVRKEWKRDYDFVLLDSRTGVTDIGDLCTVVLPDRLALLFVTNEQNVAGVASVYRRALKAQENLRAERARLKALPILSRDEFYSEYDKSLEWRKRAADRLAPLFDDWLPSEVDGRSVDPIDVFQKIFIPYFAIWSFGESLPAIERPAEVSNPASINAAYSRIAHLILSDLDWTKMSVFADAGEAAAKAQRDFEAETAELQSKLDAAISDVAAEQERAEQRAKEVAADAAERERKRAAKETSAMRMRFAAVAMVALIILGGGGYAIYSDLQSQMAQRIAANEVRAAEDSAKLQELRIAVEQAGDDRQVLDDLKRQLSNAEDALKSALSERDIAQASENRLRQILEDADAGGDVSSKLIAADNTLLKQENDRIRAQLVEAEARVAELQSQVRKLEREVKRATDARIAAERREDALRAFPRNTLRP